jgi:hypothetical protein
VPNTQSALTMQKRTYYRSLSAARDERVCQFGTFSFVNNPDFYRGHGGYFLTGLTGFTQIFLFCPATCWQGPFLFLTRIDTG